MKRYYVCVNDCGYKIGPYKNSSYVDYDEVATGPNSNWACNNCPEENYTDENGIERYRRPRLKAAPEYNQKELAAMKRAEFIAMGLPPGGPKLKVQKASKFGEGILDIE